jgi:mitogen-activated protein kinase kinase kinase
MALLSARAPGSTSYSNVANYRVQPSTQHHGFFASPTESEFSEHYDTPNSIRYARVTTPGTLRGQYANRM